MSKKRKSSGDEQIDVLVDRIKRWTKVDAAEINGKPTKPDYAEAEFSVFTTTKLHAVKGGVVTDPKYSTIREPLLRTRVFIGDEKRGCGAMFDDSSDAPFDGNPSVLAAELDTLFDDNYKNAEADYHDERAEAVKVDESGFRRLAPQEPIVDIGSTKLPSVDLDKICRIAAEASDRLYWGIGRKKNGSEIVDGEIKATIEEKVRRYANSEGTMIRDSSWRAYYLAILTVLDKDGQRREYYKNMCVLTPKELYDKKALLAEVDYLLQVGKEVMACEPLISGPCPVILDPKAFGTFLHEAFAAHLISGEEVLYEHATTFDVMQLGEMVTSPNITIYDDASLTGGFGSFAYDAEGTPSQRTVLIENGILKNHLHDRVTAAKLPLVVNKKRRDSKGEYDHFRSNGKLQYAYKDPIYTEDDDSDDSNWGNPEPRTSNLVAEAKNLVPLDKLKDELIKLCRQQGRDYGLLVTGTSGDVDIEGGDFRIYPLKMTKINLDGSEEPVSRARAMCNPHTFLRDIRMLGGEYGISRGFCGSDSGTIPTETRAPYALVSTVEFKSEEEDALRPMIIERRRYTNYK